VSIDAEPKPRGFLAKLKKRLNRGTAWLGSGVASAFGRNIDESTLAELEDELLLADAGIEATESLIAELRSKARRADSKDRPLADLLRECVAEALLPLEQPLLIEKSDSPRVILVVGVNGTGKTTTIGKLAQRLRSQGFSVLLAAARLSARPKARTRPRSYTTRWRPRRAVASMWCWPTPPADSIPLAD
jgi:fused signal recognition particle receptor